MQGKSGKNNSTNARRLGSHLSVGYPQLTLAKFIVIAESLLRDFLRPLLIIGFFIALAWIGVFTGLYPWAHLVAFIVFFLSFFDSLGNALASRKHISYSAAKRRVEIASHLPHRPLDTLEDHPFAAEVETLAIWQEHRSRIVERLDKLKWPQWMLDLSGQDPYALRQALGILLVLGLVVGWGTLGGRLINAINPSLGNMALSRPTLSAWITPPEYTGMPPIMIATPADMRHDKSVLAIPEGSTITAHIAEREGVAPNLAVNDESLSFADAKDGGYGISETIVKGDTLRIRHGWRTLGEWKIKIVSDKAPTIEIKSQPKATERHSTRIEYKASDDYGIQQIEARIEAVETRDHDGDSDNTPLVIQLGSPKSKEIDTVDYQDLTASPLAGTLVSMTLAAKDGAGHETLSPQRSFILPERSFSNPVAKALIEERKKLLSSVLDSNIRNEVANIMAGVAQQPASYGHDPVTLMSLRGGAVRLVLGRNNDDVSSIKEILWHAAVRIEEGATGQIEKALRQAQKDLSDAINRNASEDEIQGLIDQLQHVMAQYLAAMQTRMATAPAPLQNLREITGTRLNILTPDMLKQRLDLLRDLASGGEREKALQELARLQEMMENIPVPGQNANAELMQHLEALQNLRQLREDQEDVLKESQSAKNGARPSKDLADTQKNIGKQASHMADKLDGLAAAAQMMNQSASGLQRQHWQSAIDIQKNIIEKLGKLEASAKEQLKQALQNGGQGMMMGSSDPFGQSSENGMPGQPSNNHIILPAQLKAQQIREILNDLRSRAGDGTRSPVERDYIERLLQNF